MDTYVRLPGPRIWTPVHLAQFFGFSIHWVYKVTSAKSSDPPPRCPGVSRLRFDTDSLEFQEWLKRQLGHGDAIDIRREYKV
jgi:hypothetical protein